MTKPAYNVVPAESPLMLQATARISFVRHAGTLAFTMTHDALIGEEDVILGMLRCLPLWRFLAQVFVSGATDIQGGNEKAMLAPGSVSFLMLLRAR